MSEEKEMLKFILKLRLTYRSGGEVWSKEDGHDSDAGILASS